MITKYKKLIYGLSLYFLASILITAIFIYSQNNVLNNQSWIPEKTALDYPPGAPAEPLLNRGMLALGRLNLQKYNGYQEIYYKKPIALKKLKINFNINVYSHLDIIFNRDSNNHAGIRLATPEYTNSYFESENTGKFLTTNQITELNVIIKKNTWQTIEIIENQNGLEIKIDNNKVATIEGKYFLHGDFGLRAGRTGALVSRVELVDKSGEVFSEDFLNLELFWQVYTKSIHYILILLAGVGFLIFLLKLELPNIDRFYKSGKFINYSLALYAVFDFFCYSNAETFINRNLRASANPIFSYIDLESVRYNFFEQWSKFTLNKQNIMIKKKLDPNRFKELAVCVDSIEACRFYDFKTDKERIKFEKKDINILLMGGSFTRGYGAKEEKDVYVNKVFQFLRKQYPRKKINITIYTHGAEKFTFAKSLTHIQIDTYNQHIKELKPDLIIYTPFKSEEVDVLRLEKFIYDRKKEKTKFMIFTQPRSLDKTLTINVISPEDIKKKVNAFLEMFKRNNIPVFSLEALLNSDEVKRGGSIWWDSNHIKSYGQEIIAQQLAQEIVKILDN